MRLSLAIVLVALTGCVSTQELQAIHQEIAATTPMCYSAETCEAAWAAARSWIQDNAGFKLQTYSTDFMETYNPTNSSPELAVSVSKEPVGGGRYQLTARLWCANMFGCQPNEAIAHLAFNKFVNARIAQIALATPTHQPQ